MSKKTIGEVLKNGRDLIPMTLRQVEDATGISNAYLSQLENNKIKKPSPNVLYKLGKLYKIDMDTLLYACGIITNDPQKGSGLLENIGKLSPKEEEQLTQYLKFLRSQKK